MQIKKPNLNIRQYITLYIGGLALVLVVAYSLLMYEYAHRGLSQATTRDLLLEAKDFDRLYKIDPNTPLPTGTRMSSYLGLENLPSWVKEKAAPDKYSHTKLMYGPVPENIMESLPGSRGLFLLYPYDLYNSSRLFLLKVYSSEDRISNQYFDVRTLQKLAWPLGALFVILVVIVVRVMLHRLSRPIERLNSWASELTPDRVNENHPDFSFNEINMMADLLQNTVNQLNSALVREHRFLRNASHELRTPVAVLRSNIDLLDRLKPDLGKAEKRSLERIRRAVDNMSQLMETLLWINRSSDNPPEPVSIPIDSLVTELIKENSYLLHSKDIKITEDLEQSTAVIPLTAIRIALGNLIRNAFQYTIEGEIHISAKDNSVSIRNMNKTETASSGDETGYGFGIGLDLVEQITDKMGWDYQVQSIPGGREVVLQFIK